MLAVAVVSETSKTLVLEENHVSSLTPRPVALLGLKLALTVNDLSTPYLNSVLSVDNTILLAATYLLNSL